MKTDGRINCQPDCWNPIKSVFVFFYPPRNVLWYMGTQALRQSPNGLPLNLCTRVWTHSCCSSVLWDAGKPCPCHWSSKELSLPSLEQTMHVNTYRLSSFTAQCHCLKNLYIPWSLHQLSFITILHYTDMVLLLLLSLLIMLFFSLLYLVTALNVFVPPAIILQTKLYQVTFECIHLFIHI